LKTLLNEFETVQEPAYEANAFGLLCEDSSKTAVNRPSNAGKTLKNSHLLTRAPFTDSGSLELGQTRC
jgi:hypothetical protein